MPPEPPAAPRAVADTNVVISGLLWRGAERKLLDAARAGQISLYTSAALLAELAEVLPRAKFAKRVAADMKNYQGIPIANATEALTRLPQR